MSDLEKRISAALSDNGLGSADLSQLISEAEAGIAAADAEAKSESERAYDPLQAPDPQAARERMENAVFAAGRLKTLLPRLGQRYSDVRLAEERARFEQDYLAVKERQDALAAKFRETYSRATIELIVLFCEMDAVDRECGRINHSASALPNEFRRLGGVELTARGMQQFADYAPSIVAGVRIPSCANSAAMAWPPPQPSFAVACVQAMPTLGGPRYSADWAAARAMETQDAEARAAERVAAEEKDAAERQRRYYESLGARAR